MTPLNAIPAGAWFRFPGDPTSEPGHRWDGAFQSNGNGWYGRPYSGGPWHIDRTTQIVPCSPEECQALDTIAADLIAEEDAAWQRCRSAIDSAASATKTTQDLARFAARPEIKSATRHNEPPAHEFITGQHWQFWTEDDPRFDDGICRLATYRCVRSGNSMPGESSALWQKQSN